MANTVQTEKEMTTFENILEQIKIVIVIYGIIAVIHINPTIFIFFFI